MDTLRNRLVIWGGGHTSYYGNELYSVNLTDLTIHRINDPSIPTNYHGGTNTCVTTLADGTPNTRHTYDSMSYLPNVDRMLIIGGSLGCENGGGANDAWTFDFATMTWHLMSPSGTVPPADVYTSAYDPNTGKVFVHDSYDLYVYDYDANRFTKLSPDTAVDYHLTAVIDPVRKKYVMMGNGQAWFYDISSGSSYTRQNLMTTGGDAIINARYPGLAYDPVIDQIVAWSGGDTVYKLNLDTNVWTTETFTGGPGAAQINGTYKRWSYSPASNVFMLVNDMNQDAFAFRLNSGGGTPPSTDSIPPTISLTAPTFGATISGSGVTVSANATDNVGVVGVQFKVDGTNVGAEDTVAPYVILWNTTSATNGSHTLSAVARDAAGNQTTSASLSVTVNNAPPISSPSDFSTRCAAPGVIKCVGFDSDADFNIGMGGYSGAYGESFGIIPPFGTTDYTRAVRDTTQKASGSSSLKFTIPAMAPADTSGSWFTNFSDDLSIQYGERSEFYVQWRQRFSSEFLTNVYAGPLAAYRGSGYSTGVKSTTGGSGAGLTINVLSLGTGNGIASFSIVSGGTGYVPGDIITASTGDANATYLVVLVSNGGVVTTLRDGDAKTGWKLFGILSGDQVGTPTPFCTAIDITIQNTYLRGFPIMYHSCTGSTSHGAYNPFEESFMNENMGGAFDIKLENARPSPYCTYDQGFTVPKTYFSPNGNCFAFVADEWTTFQIHVVTGPRGSNGVPGASPNDEFVNSHIDMWAAHEGQASVQLFDWGPYNLSAGTGMYEEKFGKTVFLPYQTNKDPSIAYPVAYTWYDDFVISKNKIADPIARDASVTDTTPPTVTLTITTSSHP